jgi:nucleotide-binding universal stress UspA family protein
MVFKKILIAVDESSFAAYAADAGLDLARQLGADVAFVTVIDPANMRLTVESGIAEDRWYAMEQSNAKGLLNSFAARAETARPPLDFIEIGNPANMIVAAAKNWPADLIVMGTHGRGAVSNLLMGSVAQGVLHHAPCPVMVLRAHD